MAHIEVGGHSAATLGTRVGPLRSGLPQHYTLRMDNLPLNLTRWNDRLAFDIALTLEGSGEPIGDVVKRHRIDPADLLEFKQDPVFLRKVDHYRNEIREKGITFRLKARAQAEELLTTSWLLIHDPAVSPTVKADLIKSTVKWAGLEPKDTGPADGGGGGVKITINLGSNAADARTIDVAQPLPPTPYLDYDDAHDTATDVAEFVP